MAQLISKKRCTCGRRSVGHGSMLLYSKFCCISCIGVECLEFLVSAMFTRKNVLLLCSDGPSLILRAPHCANYFAAELYIYSRRLLFAPLESNTACISSSILCRNFSSFHFGSHPSLYLFSATDFKLVVLSVATPLTFQSWKEHLPRVVQDV